MVDNRRVQANLDEDLDLIDRWAMNALIPGEKELAILMRWATRSPYVRNRSLS
jgi:hypothetical protein